MKGKLWSAHEGKILPLGFTAPGLIYIHTYIGTYLRKSH